MHWKYTLSLIQSEVSFIGNYTLRVANSSMHEFIITQTSKVRLNPPKAPKIVKVFWLPQVRGWIKCNINGSFINSLASCGGIFQNQNEDFLFGFSDLVDSDSSLHAKLFGALKAIEFASHLGLVKLWLVTDSKMVILATQDSKIVPWSIQCTIFDSRLSSLLSCFIF